MLQHSVILLFVSCFYSWHVTVSWLIPPPPHPVCRPLHFTSFQVMACNVPHPIRTNNLDLDSRTSRQILFRVFKNLSLSVFLFFVWFVAVVAASFLEFLPNQRSPKEGNWRKTKGFVLSFQLYWSKSLSKWVLVVTGRQKGQHQKLRCKPDLESNASHLWDGLIIYY